jgi:LacI family transcriptional regulator
MEGAMTIKEIANALQVSTATVSNVIHGHLEKMSPETAQRIREKLEHYQYIPNMCARMLANGDSQILGIITNYPNREEKFALQDPFVSEMIGALENTIRTSGYYTMLHAAQNAVEIHRIAQTWNADGLIVMGLQANQCRELMKATKKPVVFIDCYFDTGEQYNNIGLDDQGGMYRITKYLLSLGHKDILFIGDQPMLWGVDARRLKGHIEALAKEGIPWADERYAFVSKDRKRRSQDFDRLAQRLERKRDTVWMFISDYYAVDAIDYLLDHGLRVPEDISVTGFDDNILAHTIRPRLTTIHQNVSQKAEMAVKTLLELLGDNLDTPFSLMLSTRLIKGQSVKALNSQRTPLE